MRSISAAIALYALCLTILLVPESNGPRREPRDPQRLPAESVRNETDHAPDEQIKSTLQSPSANQIDIVGPLGSGRFGTHVTVLPNGNIVVTDPSFSLSSPSFTNGVGAVHLYNGETLQRISTLTGSKALDQVGYYGITVLSNGNFVVKSGQWRSTVTAVAGAVTWCHADTGCSGIVSDQNSIVGSTDQDWIGASAASVFALANGNFVVAAPYWDNGSVVNAGAIIWGDGENGTSGTISSANALVGSTTDDQIGTHVTALTNGAFVTSSGLWGSNNAGAATWDNGVGPISGTVSASNSLVGSAANNEVGNGGIVALTNGNYVVRSTNWDNGGTANVGAATWGNGLTGIVGTVSSSNSLVGSAAGDIVGTNGITPLTNGNYVVHSAAWGANDVGAATWCSGTIGRSGTISSANSLIGSTTNDYVGREASVALSNGNYVVVSSGWGSTDIGAVTWGDGTTGITGTVSASNSMVGSTSNDGVGSGTGAVIALTNGNYVVAAQFWGAADVGAVRWGNGNGGTVGAISSANSLVGSSTTDRVGTFVRPLANGNYVVSSPYWGSTDLGAATFGDGLVGVTGAVTTANSLTGSVANDQVGIGGVTALQNGNYVVTSSQWNNGTIVDAGAVTWGNGLSGIVGPVSTTNSLAGTTASDFLGIVTPMPNGNYFVRSQNWDNGSLSNAGAVTYGPGNGPLVGNVDASNSVRGTTGSGGSLQTAASIGTLPSHERLVVGRPASNIVTIFNPKYTAVADGNWSSAGTWNYGAFEKPHDVVIPSGRTVTLDGDVPGPGGSVMVESGGQLVVDGERSSASPISNSGVVDLSMGKLNMGANLFSSVCGAIENGYGASNYIVGAAQKEFCSTGGHTFPVGTADGYAPVNVNITALNTNPSSLTISSTASPHPELFAANSLGRFWSISETGDLTADLIFNYLESDVEGVESSYKLYRVSGGDAVLQTGFTFDAGANTMTMSGVSEFSDWAIGNLAPTAAGVSVSGRVTANDRPVSRASVVFYGADGSVRYAVTNTFGYYRIDGLMAGSTYTATVESRRYTFDARVVDLSADLTDLNFSAR